MSCINGMPTPHTPEVQTVEQSNTKISDIKRRNTASESVKPEEDVDHEYYSLEEHADVLRRKLEEAIADAYVTQSLVSQDPDGITEEMRQRLESSNAYRMKFLEGPTSEGLDDLESTLDERANIEVYSPESSLDGSDGADIRSVADEEVEKDSVDSMIWKAKLSWIRKILTEQFVCDQICDALSRDETEGDQTLREIDKEHFASKSAGTSLKFNPSSEDLQSYSKTIQMTEVPDIAEDLHRRLLYLNICTDMLMLRQASDDTE